MSQSVRCSIFLNVDRERKGKIIYVMEFKKSWSIWSQELGVCRRAYERGPGAFHSGFNTWKGNVVQRCYNRCRWTGDSEHDIIWHGIMLPGSCHSADWHIGLCSYNSLHDKREYEGLHYIWHLRLHCNVVKLNCWTTGQLIICKSKVYIALLLSVTRNDNNTRIFFVLWWVFYPVRIG
jgi:hypothetical protein